MATHDYVLDNASGAAFRTDLNNALAAIVSNNSNNSSPATTYAYQWWADTSAGVLKIRNSANSDWIELFQLDGTLTLENGSVTAPALAFRDDLNTGLYQTSNDDIRISTGGVERLSLDGNNTVFNEDGANTDFRIEGDTDANLFYVDAGNNRIGIGSSSPNYELQVNDPSGTLSAIQITNTTTGTAGSDGFLIYNNGNNALLSNEEAGDLRLQTSGQQRLTIDSNGIVMVGATVGTGKFIVQDSSLPKIQSNFNGAAHFEHSVGGSGGGFAITTGHFISFNQQPYANRGTDTNLTERLRILSDGKVAFNSNGTVNATYQFDYAPATGGIIVNANASFTGNSTALQFRTAPSTTSGNITLTNDGATTAYGTTSDYRLKENAIAISDGITRLKTLKPYRFNFKAAPDITVDGFFAHEVTAVPEAIVGDKDETKNVLYTEEDTIPSGKKVGDVKEVEPVYQSMDYAKITPLLTAALQEAIAKIETLETKVAALEAA